MMQRKLLTLFLAPIASLALLASNAHAQTGAAARPIGPCLALRVVDGDSADLRCGADLVRVRMRNVAAPRLGQVGYTEAVRGLAELLRARELYVVSDVPGELPLDPNGRVLAYLCDRSGANLNIAFVLLGWATYSTDAGAGRFERSFRVAEQQAHAEHRALWTVWSVTADR
jgi:endonuclease YncB( thermonuclease family)